MVSKISLIKDFLFGYLPKEFGFLFSYISKKFQELALIKVIIVAYFKYERTTFIKKLVTSLLKVTLNGNKIPNLLNKISLVF